MKHALIVLILGVFVIPFGFSQELKTELGKWIQTEFTTGEYTFEIMTYKFDPIQKNKRILTDDNGNVLMKSASLVKVSDENEFEYPTSRFKSIGSVDLKITYQDSILTIRPLGNSFCPIVKINLRSTAAQINNDTLKILKKVSIPNKKNAFKSSWEGFKWYLKSPKDSFNIQPRLTVGKLLESLNIYIEIIWFEQGNRMHYRLLN